MNTTKLPIEIKQIGADHLAQLQDISRETFRQTFEDSNNPEDLKKFLDAYYNQEKLLKELQNPNSFFFFAYFNNELCAYIKLNVNDAQLEAMGDDAIELERIYVMQAFQGKKIGQYLLNFTHEKAKELNKNILWLGVWEHNEPAKAFYQKNDFIPFGKHIFMVGSDNQTDILLKKKL